MRSTYVLSVLLLLLAASCINYPSPCFQAPTLVKVGDSIHFTNCTVDGYSYYWWFDDGTESTEAEPTKVYTKRGKYRVYMTAFTKNGHHQKKANTIIEVGNLFLDELRINAFPATVNGQPWDPDGSGPDVRITYGPAGQPAQYTTIEVGNITTDSLPLVFLPLGDIQLTPETWQFNILDIDGSSLDPMRTFTLNPHDEDPGTIRFEVDGWNFHLGTSVR